MLNKFTKDQSIFRKNLITKRIKFKQFMHKTVLTEQFSVIKQRNRKLSASL